MSVIDRLRATKPADYEPGTDLFSEALLELADRLDRLDALESSRAAVPAPEKAAEPEPLPDGWRVESRMVPQGIHVNALYQGRLVAWVDREGLAVLPVPRIPLAVVRRLLAEAAPWAERYF